MQWFDVFPLLLTTRSMQQNLATSAKHALITGSLGGEPCTLITGSLGGEPCALITGSLGGEPCVDRDAMMNYK